MFLRWRKGSSVKILVFEVVKGKVELKREKCTSGRVRALYAPPCRIFVFEDLVYEFAEANGVSVCAKEVPTFFVGGFGWVNV